MQFLKKIFSKTALQKQHIEIKFLKICWRLSRGEAEAIHSSYSSRARRARPTSRFSKKNIRGELVFVGPGEFILKNDHFFTKICKKRS